MSLLKMIRSILFKSNSNDTISLPPSYDDIETLEIPSYEVTSYELPSYSETFPPNYSEVSKVKKDRQEDKCKMIVNNIRNKKYNMGAYVFDKDTSVSNFVRYIIKNNCNDIVVYALYSNNKIMIANNNYFDNYSDDKKIVLIAADRNQTVRIGNEFINKCKGNNGKAILIVARYLDNNKKSICTNYLAAFDKENIKESVRKFTSVC